MNTILENLKRFIDSEVRRTLNEERETVYEVTLNEKKSKKSKSKKDSSKVKRRQVLAMMNQDKIDLAALGRKLYPDMDDDTSRSYISKKARGERELSDSEVNKLYTILHSNKDKQIR